MDTTLILDAENDGVIEILSNAPTMRTWEFVRGTGGVCTITELVDATDLDRVTVQEQADALVTLGLLQKVRARKPRRVPGYRATCERIISASTSTTRRPWPECSRSADPSTPIMRGRSRSTPTRLPVDGGISIPSPGRPAPDHG